MIAGRRKHWMYETAAIVSGELHLISVPVLMPVEHSIRNLTTPVDTTDWLDVPPPHNRVALSAHSMVAVPPILSSASSATVRGGKETKERKSLTLTTKSDGHVSSSIEYGSNRIYLSDGSANAYETICYDQASMKWLSLPDRQYNRLHNACMVYLKGSLIIFGGQNSEHNRTMERLIINKTVASAASSTTSISSSSSHFLSSSAIEVHVDSDAIEVSGDVTSLASSPPHTNTNDGNERWQTMSTTLPCELNPCHAHVINDTYLIVGTTNQFWCIELFPQCNTTSTSWRPLGWSLPSSITEHSTLPLV
jgi:hypothetical protein